MNESTHQRAIRIVRELATVPPEQHQTVMEHACQGDTELRDQVEKLLKETAEIPSTVHFDESTRASEPPADSPFADLAGRNLGDYELLEELGRGGMGVVYRARQISLDRTVAVKVIRVDRDGGDLLERFRREAESAAMLDHPNIVPIHEIGEADGIVYFSMKLVEGSDLQRALQDSELDLKSRIRWLAAVARAVHYLHQNGIIHRDLKPGNILLDEAGTPYVTDFGLAKQVDQELEMTQTGQLLGTPRFMSPEQVKAGKVPVMTSSDVYSLGVILFESITGTPLVTAATIYETIMQVIENEPPRPGSLNPSIDRDLDQICLKCLRKQPDDRYASADALADDLDAWLRGDAVRARPLNGTQRLWRWCRRRPAAAATWVTIATLLCVAVGLIAWKWREAEYQTKVANAATEEAEGERIVARQQRDRAQKHFGTARDALTNFVVLVDEDTQLQRAGLHQLRSSLLESAMPFFEALTDDESYDQSAEEGRVEAFFRLAKIHAAQGQLASALESFESAIDGYRMLSEQFPDERSYRQQMAGVCNDLAQLHRERGEDELAFEQFGKALELQRDLVAEQPDDINAQHSMAQFANNLGTYYLDHGQLDDAQKALELALEIHQRLSDANPESHWFESDEARHLFNLGSVQYRRGDSSRAKQLYLDSAEINRELARRFPNVPEHWQWEYEVQAQLAVVCFERSEFEQARDHYRAAVENNEIVARRFPMAAGCQVDLARNRKYWAIAQQRLGDVNGALADLAAAVDDYQVAVDRFPSNLSIRDEMASCLHRLAGMFSSAGNHEEAARQYDQSIAIRRGSERISAGHIDNLVGMGGSQCNRGNSLRAAGRLAESLVQLAEAVTTLESVVDANPNHDTARRFLVNSFCNRAITREYLGEYATATNDWQRAHTLDGHSSITAQRLTIAQAVAQAQQGSPDEAATQIEQLITETSRSPSILYRAAAVYCYCHRACEPNDPRAATYLERAMKCLAEAHSLGYLARSDILREVSTVSDFDPLRNLEQFQSLLAELQR